MKNFKVFILLLACSVMISCGDDEESGPSAEFIDQVAQGKINGKEWIMGSGIGEVRFGDEDNLNLRLTNNEYLNPCNVFILDGLMTIFSVSNSTGTKSIKSGFREVLLFDPNNNDNVSNYASKGGIEIVSIGTETITGKIDAYADENNFVNGNFTVPFCQD